MSEGSYICAGCRKEVAPAAIATMCFLLHPLHFCLDCMGRIEDGINRDLHEQVIAASDALKLVLDRPMTDLLKPELNPWVVQVRAALARCHQSDEPKPMATDADVAQFEQDLDDIVLGRPPGTSGRA